MRGRKPKPTRLKILEGNPGKRVLNADEPKPMRGVPPTPEYLPPRARATFEMLGARLDAMGVITIADGVALEMLAMAYEEWRAAYDILHDVADLARFEGEPVQLKDGLTYETESESGKIIRAHPAARLGSEAFRKLRAMLTEFGLTPSSRARVHAPDSAKGDTDTWDELIA
jgi:P27 family predicted phage terminase small subunit